MHVLSSSIACVEHERGQIAVVAAFVIGVMLAVIVAVALVGAAMIDRVGATAAADAVALADAIDPVAANTLVDWYQDRGFTVDVVDGQANATSDEARAASVAIADRELRVAPVIRAVVARAEQLLGTQLTVIQAEGVSVTFAPSSAQQFGAVAAELGMCATSDDRFVRC